MKFVIIGWDSPEGPQKRSVHRPAHLKRLESVEAEGKLILAGPFADQAGSLIILEAESMSEAQTFAKEDPYTVYGVFERIEIHPFHQVFPTQHPSHLQPST